MSATAPPPLPPRLSHHHQRPQLEHQQPTPGPQQPSGSQEADEPPPAYTPSPADPTTLLEVGPQYPFQNTEPQHQQLHQTQHPSYYPQAQLNHHQPPPPHHHYHHQPHQSHGLQAPPVSSSSHAAPLPAPNEPTTVPTAGRPLLYENRILVYPYVNGTAYFCPKCCNTGFKGFDPNRPCRKKQFLAEKQCWTKYGKSWSVVRLSPMTTPSSTYTLQRPLPPNDVVVTPPPLVVRPGDPRIGGRLCLNCNGSGQKIEELTLFNVFTGGPNQEVCYSCRGTGRIFF
ncbi:hypothetical protein Pst134EA_004601 [Puccinia striiformis f. sp. tritici]|uniref:hypothetical protein n=1 Tax=Puccinia striiformis f. sp. tritici TaxID=168172 RepID=UPI002008A2C9|nr:hypothetical protein Pst134EA_004601 [Puccinia striiformis f. sp. tritici]KAH9470677.1 hypothetical protein Pst134EA_004601 [Puccinia striiformis f. sp. tritici]